MQHFAGNSLECYFKMESVINFFRSIFIYTNISHVRNLKSLDSSDKLLTRGRLYLLAKCRVKSVLTSNHPNSVRVIS